MKIQNIYFSCMLNNIFSVSEGKRLPKTCLFIFRRGEKKSKFTVNAALIKKVNTCYLILIIPFDRMFLGIYLYVFVVFSIFMNYHKIRAILNESYTKKF